MPTTSNDPFASIAVPLQSGGSDDPFASIAQPIATQYQQDVANRPGVTSATPAGLQGPPQPDVLSTMANNLRSNLPSPIAEGLIGAAKGIGSTVSGIDNLVAKIPVIGKPLTTPMTSGDTSAQARQQLQQAVVPSNTAQSVGKGIEQAGEFLLPGAGEEKAASWFTGKAAPLVAKVAPIAERAVNPVAKLLYGAGTSGAMNALQGRSFGAGAAAGGIASGIGQGMQAIAPAVAESAFGIRGVDRAAGRTPGQAILDETTGFKPSTVANQAQRKASSYTAQMENALDNAPDVSLSPARQIANDALYTATQRNNPETIKRTGAIAKQLTSSYGTDAKPIVQDLFGTTQKDSGLVDEFGNPITSPVSSKVGQVETQLPETVPASKALQLKRGIGDLKNSWNPATQNDLADSTVGRVYHSLDDQLEQAAPGASALNQRISSLLPVAKRATATDLGPGSLQKIMNYSPFAGTVIGGVQGGREGGIEGAIKGAATGAVTGAVLRSPTGRMALARVLYGTSPEVTRTIAAGTLQATRKK